MESTTNTKRILFYGIKNDYGCFSNFYPSPIELEGKTWPTVEHYFQAKKFEGTPMEEKIRNAETPKEAKRLGRSNSVLYKKRDDWETIRNDFMLTACLAKFTQHINLKKELMRTGDAELVENAATDYYWGCGKDGTGENKLGKILMEVREQLKINTNK
jgi:ribA/ribD-fused uncharacterized protein